MRTRTVQETAPADGGLLASLGAAMGATARALLAFVAICASLAAIGYGLANAQDSERPGAMPAAGTDCVPMP